ncbi:hypothetical protein SAMN03003324_00893 [Pedobacter antarcticus]|uniref:Uncharacterized protein n=1 Tax=Pedobacter antarcticus TaxID=34086 RepID=A0A1I2BJG3_9SPHI|nr:hypothetical protein SAMN03003324_00893 [Pedobacter antarcticus]
MAKKIRYKTVQVNLPENISLNYLKKMVDTLGKDYCCSIQQIVDFLSDNKLQ